MEVFQKKLKLVLRQTKFVPKDKFQKFLKMGENSFFSVIHVPTQLGCVLFC